jgi:hypothetical protein
MGSLSGLWYSIGCMNLVWSVVCWSLVRDPLAAPRVVVRVSISCITFDMKDEIIFVHCGNPEVVVHGLCMFLARCFHSKTEVFPYLSHSDDNRKCSGSIHFMSRISGHTSAIFRGCDRIADVCMTHFLVHSLAVVKNFALSFFNSTAMSGSNGSSGEGLLTLS